MSFISKMKNTVEQAIEPDFSVFTLFAFPLRGQIVRQHLRFVPAEKLVN